MSDPVLWPMQPLGALPDERSRVLLYGERDLYGVEPAPPEPAPADFTGPNEAADFVRRWAAALSTGHYPTGAHRDLRIPRAALLIQFVALGNVRIDEASVLVTAAGEVLRGAAAASAEWLSEGRYKVTLAAPMPGVYRVVPAVNPTLRMLGPTETRVVVNAFLEQILSPSQFIMALWQGESVNVLDHADGDLVALVHGIA